MKHVGPCHLTSCAWTVAAACTADGKGITYNDHINVAMAVTMPDGGLITPVLKVELILTIQLKCVCACACACVLVLPTDLLFPMVVRPTLGGNLLLHHSVLQMLFRPAVYLGCIVRWHVAWPQHVSHTLKDQQYHVVYVAVRCT